MNDYTLELLAHDREQNAIDHEPTADELDEIDFDNERIRIEEMLREERAQIREMDAERTADNWFEMTRLAFV